MGRDKLTDYLEELEDQEHGVKHFPDEDEDWIPEDDWF